MRWRAALFLCAAHRTETTTILMAITLANLLIKVRADTASLSGDLNKVAREAGQIGRRVGQAEIPVRKLAIGLGAVAAAGAGMAVVGKELFDIGAAVEETANKYTTVLGPALEETDRFLEQNATRMGLSMRVAQDTVATVTAMAQGFGFATEQAAGLGRDVTRLGADLASFHNIQGGAAEGAQIVATALAGERERLKQLGIVVMEAEVQQRALAATGKDVAASLTQAEKAAATYQLIVEKAGVAVGDLDRTQDSAANTARRIAARFADVRDMVATGVMPALEDMLPVLDQLASRAQEWAEQTASVTKAVLELAGIADQELSIELAGITAQLREMEDAQKQAFLLSRLQRASAEYESLRMEIERLTEVREREGRLGGNTATRLGDQIEDLREDMQRAGSVMNFISEQLSMVADSAAEATSDVQSLAEALGGLSTSRNLIPSGLSAGLSMRLAFGGGGGSGTGAFGRRTLDDSLEDLADRTAMVAENMEPLNVELAGTTSHIEDFKNGVQGAVDGLFDFGQIGSNLASQGLGMLIGGFADAVFNPQDYVSALEANTRALEEASGARAAELEAMAEANRGSAFLSQVFRDMAAELRASSALDMARRRIEAQDITDPGAQFQALQGALAGVVSGSGPFGLGGLRGTVLGLTLDNIDEFLNTVLDQVAAGTFDVSRLGGLSLNEFLDLLAEMERLGDATAETADAMSDLAGILNAPQGFKVAALRFVSSDPEDLLPGGPGPRGGRGGRGSASPMMTPVVVQVSGRTLFEIMGAEGQLDHSLGGPSPVGITPQIRRR